MNKENCASKLVDEIILYCDARLKKHQTPPLRQNKDKIRGDIHNLGIKVHRIIHTQSLPIPRKILEIKKNRR